jgi:hypothetical protein
MRWVGDEKVEGNRVSTSSLSRSAFGRSFGARCCGQARHLGVAVMLATDGDGDGDGKCCAGESQDGDAPL